ncbi:unnamed protein product [Tilletia controversa]|uniref:Glutamine amidotransferase domain-containing protein n=2 Tax=Tilletia TaxID=13289 RepID=A0A8X7STR0_9BASI|nr:hypothetical protein CF336_g43 [Tilletia laevis]KAE8203452.1 hypothetical protein CF328_g1642 [Tilletia controversa]KAE8264687.1 hypothetical protein A4X03_0g766 [Tilletia caries]KAE8205977.1 hypothetical protein CF335_g2118 [Tilletia laevis]KAE8240967.1 hypothetical protein A4X06_0g7708 [Tilletia controversa]
MPAKKVITIALLVADTPVPAVVETWGEYPKIFSTFLKDALASIPRHHWQESIELDIRPFDVVKAMKYPDDGQLADGLYDAVLVTGSASSAYLDLEWTNKLSDFIRHLAEDHPLVRIIGICYGHQIIARAFGGKVFLNEAGWEVGTYQCTLTEDGQEYLGYGPELEMAVQQFHRDIISLPPPFEGAPFLNLAHTPKTPSQALALPYPTDAPPLPSTVSTSDFVAFDMDDSGTASSGPHPARKLHVLSLQGHPEFEGGIVRAILGVRTEMGVITEGEKEEAIERAGRPHDGRRLGVLILAMLGVEAAKDESGGAAIPV